MSAVRRALPAAVTVLLGTAQLPAQGDHGAAFPAPRHEYSPVLSFLSPLLLPKILQDAWCLREYVRGEEFTLARRVYGDCRAVDALYVRALDLSWGSVGEALLLSTVVTMDHRRFGVKSPLFGLLFWIPLTSEFEEEFEERVRNLPAHLFPDSPPTDRGDRDKLQHFFGSALIAYLFESGDAAERMGEFVEWGEERFIVDGVMDPRDLRANRQGQEFGLRLVDDRTVLPSAFLQFVLATSDEVPTPPVFPGGSASEEVNRR